MPQSITKIVEWDMGHRVPNHKSKCRNMHGHRYRAEITIGGELCDIAGDSSEGMVIDFGDIKQIMMEEVHDVLDHGFMHYSKDELCKTAFDAVKEHDQKIIVVPFIPTAENLAGWIWQKIEGRLEKDYNCMLHVIRVRLYETPNSWADYGPGC